MTGATGLLGRNVLFECLHRFRHDLSALHVTVLGADRHGATVVERVHDILLDDGMQYLSISSIPKRQLQAWSATNLRGVCASLEASGLGLTDEGVSALADRPYDHVLHIASDTDFRAKPAVVDRLRAVNLEGTRRLLRVLAELEHRAVTYVGTAYSCGATSGVIAPDLIRMDQEFRNPYEKVKLEAECEVRDYAARTGTPLYVFRPSTICGRLIHPALGRLRNFNVFYAYGGLLARFREKLTGTPVPQGRLELPLRLPIVPERGLNIVPVDYAAKVMVEVLERGAAGSYHLVNDTDTLNDDYIRVINESLKIDGVEMVNEHPNDLNPFEGFLYRFLVPIFAPYCNAEPTSFSTANLSGMLDDVGRCPPVCGTNLDLLIAYAQSRNFGVPVPDQRVAGGASAG